MALLHPQLAWSADLRERAGTIFVASLEEAVPLMAWHQLGVKLSDAQVADVVTFLGSLTGEVDADYVARPELPASGPATPKPDPS
jgi:cytochrome c peroxidase